MKAAEAASGAYPANHLVAQFIYLQMLDFLSTLAFLAHGVQEANPVVRAMMEWGNSPWSGLLAVKVLAVGLGLFCWKSGRYRLLSRANWAFAGLVVWNLMALIVSRFVS
jgi:hypothetical protein